MKDELKFYAKAGLLILLGTLFIWILYMARGVLWPFVLAFLLSYILTPVVEYLCNKKLPRLLAVFLTYTILVAILVLIMLVIIPGLINTLREISGELPRYVDAVKKYMGFLQKRYEQLGLPWEWEELTGQILRGINTLLGKAMANITGIFSGIFLFILSLIVSFYLLKDARKIRGALINYTPKNFQKEVSEFLTEVDKVLGGYVRGQLVIATIVGVSIGIGLFLLNIKYAFLLGIIAGAFNIVPYLGPVIAIIPALLLALTKDPTSAWIFVWIVLLFTGVNQVEALFLSPHILGREVRLHPVAVIFAIIVGGAALGMMGVLLAIPVLALLKALFIRLTQKKE